MHVIRVSLAERWKVVVLSMIVLTLVISGIWAGYTTWLRSMEYLHARERVIDEFRWNFSSASGFDLAYKGDTRKLTLLRGEKGSIELVLTSGSSHAHGLTLYGTIDASGLRAMLPPGVRAEFTPSNLTLPAGGTISVLHTITADRDAPAGSYYYHVGIGITNHGTACGASIWLVIGPYTPKGNFSLVEYFEDFIARDEINISRKVGVDIWKKYDLGYGFEIRSEGPPLNVTLEVLNIDMPEEVKLSVSEQVFVEAGSQELASDCIGAYANPEVGRTYHFKVIARSGNEIHVAHYEIQVVP